MTTYWYIYWHSYENQDNSNINYTSESEWYLVIRPRTLTNTQPVTNTLIFYKRNARAPQEHRVTSRALWYESGFADSLVLSRTFVKSQSSWSGVNSTTLTVCGPGPTPGLDSARDFRFFHSCRKGCALWGFVQNWRLPEVVLGDSTACSESETESARGHNRFTLALLGINPSGTPLTWVHSSNIYDLWHH